MRRTSFLYIDLVNELKAEIAGGAFRPGDKMYSIRKICKNYDVSAKTAVTAVDILIEENILKVMPRKGLYIEGIPDYNKHENKHKLLPLRTIVVIGNNNIFQKNSFQGLISNEILTLCNKNNLNFRTELCSCSNIIENISIPFIPRPDDGIVEVSGLPDIKRCSILNIETIRRISVDATLPMAPSVMTDNYDGMKQILLHLKELGHKKIFLGLVGNYLSNPFNDNERREAFEFLTKEMSFHGEVGYRKKAEDFLDLLGKKSSPTAIMFLRDDPACDFVKRARIENFKIPEEINVTGFDKFTVSGHDISELTTLKVSLGALGEEAFNYLLNNDPFSLSYRYRIRVKGELTVGKTTCHVKTILSRRNW